MRILNLTKLFLFAILSLGMFMPGLVYTNVAMGASNGIVNKSFPAKWNKLSKSWPLLIKDPTKLEKTLQKAGVGFNPRFAKQDKEFMVLTSTRTTELPIITVNKDVYEIRAPKHSEVITIKNLGNLKFQINGKDFKYNEYASLESNLNQMRDLLAPTAEEASLLNSMFLPSAHAIEWDKVLPWIAGGLAAVLIGVVAFMAGTKHGENKANSDSEKIIKRKNNRIRELRDQIHSPNTTTTPTYENVDADTPTAS